VRFEEMLTVGTATCRVLLACHETRRKLTASRRHTDAIQPAQMRTQEAAPHREHRPNGARKVNTLVVHPSRGNPHRGPEISLRNMTGIRIIPDA